MITPTPDSICDGCGRNAIHKFCPAYGTAIYCNKDHPEWGKADDARLAVMREEEKKAQEKKASA